MFFSYFVLCFVFAFCNSRILVLNKRFSTASMYRTEGRATPVQLEVGAQFDFSMFTVFSCSLRWLWTFPEEKPRLQGSQCESHWIDWCCWDAGGVGWFGGCVCTSRRPPPASFPVSPDGEGSPWWVCWAPAPQGGWGSRLLVERGGLDIGAYGRSLPKPT